MDIYNFSCSSNASLGRLSPIWKNEKNAGQILLARKLLISNIDFSFIPF